MDGRRNFSQDPDGEARWYPEERGYDDRGYDERGRDDRPRDDRGRDEQRGYGVDDRPYRPTRYADERDDAEPYRVPEPRGGGQEPRGGAQELRGGGQEPRGSGQGYATEPPGYDDPSGVYGSPAVSGGYNNGPAGYGDGPSGVFSPGALGRPGDGGEPADLSGEFGARTRRSEAIDRSALQRPAALGAAGPTVPAAPMSGAAAFPAGGAATFPTSGAAAFPTSGMPGGPVSGAPLSGGPTGAPPSAFMAPTALTATVPTAQPTVSGGVYQGKRPGLVTALAVVAVIFEIPVLRLFFTAVTADTPQAGATLAGMFMIPAVPMFAMGLYGLIGGAATAPGGRAWLRTPLAYLPVALLLFIAAGLAA